MKADPAIWLAAAIGIVLGQRLDGPPYGKDGAVEYAHEGQTLAKR